MKTGDYNWHQIEAMLSGPASQLLEIDWAVVGITTPSPAAAKIHDIIYRNGDFHEPSKNLRHQCASLVTIWSATHTPTLINFDNCTCVGKIPPTKAKNCGRRFSIHGIPLRADLMLFAIASTNCRNSSDNQIKSFVTDLVKQCHRIVSPHCLNCLSHNNSNFTDSSCQPLAPREIDVLKLLTKGLSNKKIARLLGTSPNTVRNQVSTILRKTGSINRTELAMQVLADASASM
ncbi:MAG: LuxR C-terminal-related transcriptional regulator [Burkholderiaceae bacterium]|jgi:DNA-binding CsgD family transcriptional regulator|nr:LuxR C-terminal-related transcriptional regulator [Burkholderiaceae bacterium]